MAGTLFISNWKNFYISKWNLSNILHLQFDKFLLRDSIKAAIQLYKLYNATDSSLDWVTLNLNQILTTRQTKFLISKSNNNKVGLNILPNRLSILNGIIPLSWLNYTIETYKIHIKKLFLSTWIPGIYKQ